MKNLLFFITLSTMFCGCRSVKESQSAVDYALMSSIIERTDSMIHIAHDEYISNIIQITQKVDSFKYSEVRDTSHTIFLGAKGDTVKEVITIYNERVIEHTTQESSKEYWEERFKQTDSLLQVAIEKQSETDSILREHNKETVVKEKPSVGDKLKWFAGGIILSVVGCIACASAFIRKN